ncbi:MAG: hypothetical protein IAF58_01940 [Leptolyngbya sp.]|nr:hypothetical protein [Candidatus Melainabacteria bacterium]
MIEGKQPSPARWLLVMPGAAIGFSIGQFLLAAWRDLVTVLPPLAFFNGAAWITFACMSAALFILLGTKAAPNYKLPTTIFLSLLAATWSGALLNAKREGLIESFLPVDANTPYLVPYACFLTVLVASFLCFDLYRREKRFSIPGITDYYFDTEDTQPHERRAFKTQLYSHVKDDDSVTFDEDDDDRPLSVPDTFTPPKYMQLTFMASDLVLLERELLKIEPSVGAYVSALRLGIAIEKDEGYQNLDGECFSFAQLMRDLAMRLSVTDAQDDRWLEIAGLFWQYEKVDETDRKPLLVQVAALLDTKQTSEAIPEEETTQERVSMG